jgi:hypothetical protein
MKILIQNDGRHAHYFIRMGLARAFEYCGHQVFIWDQGTKPATDVFDEFEPDIFISQTYNITPTIVNLIKERPHLKVEMKAGDWGPLSDECAKKHPIKLADDKEKETIINLFEETGRPNYLHIHYHADYIEQTHGGWINAGIPTFSQLSAADVFEFTQGKHIKEFDSDVCFIGGYWPYKAEVLDKWLINFCNKTKLRVKIFGNSPWPVFQYCGPIQPEYTKHALASAKICVNLHEPHSQEYGFDIVERPYKLLSNKCFVISDYVAGLKKLIPEGILYTDNPTEFHNLIEYYALSVKTKERFDIAEVGNKLVMSKHTYFNRIKEIFERFKLYDQMEQVDVKLGRKI